VFGWIFETDFAAKYEITKWENSAVEISLCDVSLHCNCNEYFYENDY
jgi:hypothetical protein